MSDFTRIDFGRPIAIFPADRVVLLPFGAQPIHFFEPRYTQMVERCIAAGNGDIARADPIAVAIAEGTLGDSDEPASLRSAVCVGRIDQHLAMPDGRHNIILQGVARASIDSIDEASGDRLFRRAWLRPLEQMTGEEPPMLEFREMARELMSGPRLRRMASSDAVLECIDREDVPTSILIELIGLAVLMDDEARYQVLAEADCRERASIIDQALHDLDNLICKIDKQHHLSWPKGMSFN